MGGGRREEKGRERREEGGGRGGESRSNTQPIERAEADAGTWPECSWRSMQLATAAVTLFSVVFLAVGVLYPADITALQEAFAAASEGSA